MLRHLAYLADIHIHAAQFFEQNIIFGRRIGCRFNLLADAYHFLVRQRDDIRMAIVRTCTSTFMSFLKSAKYTGTLTIRCRLRYPFGFGSIM